MKSRSVFFVLLMVLSISVYAKSQGDSLKAISEPDTTKQELYWFTDCHFDYPEPINPVRPVYPEIYRKSKISGTVLLEVDIDSTGILKDIRVRKSFIPGQGGFDESAIAAVKQWKFQPARGAGNKGINATVIIPLEFNYSDYKKHHFYESQ